MKYKLNQVTLPYQHNTQALEDKFKALLGVRSFKSYKILKKSIDARKKHQLVYTYTLVVEVEQAVKTNNKQIEVYQEPKAYVIPKLQKSKTKSLRPVIVGFGPAGLFCGLVLARAGLMPIIIERGQCVEDRIKTTDIFFETGALCPESNIQFGEGGAGTFSDGKLSTGIKDSFGRKEFVLETFVRAGAPEEILYANKPHIGTDYLVHVVKAMRHEIISLGGQVQFNSKLTGINIENNQIKSITMNDENTIDTKDLVLAIGHSARDTFELLATTQMDMSQKAFAIGLRIEHPQKLINESQYGKNADMSCLPVADYKLTYRTKKGRGVYSFCMCPGGYVVNSSSEENQVVCNGMSHYKRDGKNANSAILVTINPDDFGSKDILAGVEFQRQWEKKAFEITGGTYALPVQRLVDFKSGQVTQAFGTIHSESKGKITFSDLNGCLPTFVSESIKEAMTSFDQKIKGFGHPDALLTGVETRTSSPIRLNRNEHYMSSIIGIYPCGEGAGYAGGIMSAAIDGIKVAEVLINGYQ